MRRTVLAALSGGYLAALVDLTLVRFPQGQAAPNFVPLQTISYYLQIRGWDMVANLLGNVVAFVPLGFLLPAFHPEVASARHTLAFSFAVSLLIEFLQLVSGQRIADVDDVLLNTLGGLCGYLAFVVSRKLSAPRAELASE